MHQRQVLVFQRFEVPQHFVLGMVGVEHRMREVRGLARQVVGKCDLRYLVDDHFTQKTGYLGKEVEEFDDVLKSLGLVERHAHAVVGDEGNAVG